MKTLVALAMVVASFGAAGQSMSVTDVPAEVPAFRRIYVKKLDNRATMTLTAKSSNYLGRWYRGELTQPNGAWVMFDPEKVAERILDPTLVPLVQKAVDEALTLDKAFISSKPRSFKDEKGNTWVLQP